MSDLTLSPSFSNHACERSTFRACVISSHGDSSSTVSKCRTCAHIRIIQLQFLVSTSSLIGKPSSFRLVSLLFEIYSRESEISCLLNYFQNHKKNKNTVRNWAANGEHASAGVTVSLFLNEHQFLNSRSKFMISKKKCFLCWTGFRKSRSYVTPAFFSILREVFKSQTWMNCSLPSNPAEKNSWPDLERFVRKKYTGLRACHWPLSRLVTSNFLLTTSKQT